MDYNHGQYSRAVGSPCANCKRTHCMGDTCPIWIAWFRREWRKIREQAGKTTSQE